MTGPPLDAVPLVEVAQVVPDLPTEILAVVGYGLGPATRAAHPLPLAPLDDERWSASR